MKISTSKARQIAIHCQGLDGRWRMRKGKAGVVQTLERLGYVQIDTISVVQRAHHHTLWSRRPDYVPQMLLDLQAKDRQIFEYWTHAASYLPMSDYRYYLPRMQASANGPRARRWLEQNGKLAKHVMERIRKEGPLASADFDAPPGTKRGSWWSWKPAKRALEMLFNMGKLMVAERRNFQRIYDLTERVLPAEVDTTKPDPGECARFAVRRALSGLGVASMGEIRWRRGNRGAIAGAVEDLIGSGEIVRLRIDGCGDEEYFALSKTIVKAKKRRRGAPRLHILSPFDNLIIQRRRVAELFDFDYKLECYHPAPKRRWGYFCLPILWGDQFVGRLDPKADRKQKTLIVRKLMFEQGFKDYDGALAALAERLRAFAAFNECKQVVVERTVPGKVRSRLRRELGKDGQ